MERATLVRKNAASQSTNMIVSPPTGRSSPVAHLATFSWLTGTSRTGSFLRSIVASTQRFQFGCSMPDSMASARIALTTFTVWVRFR